MTRDFEQPGRSVAVGRNGMAATSNPYSTLAAVNVLQKGGNAVDAAVTAGAVQAVVESGSTGIGGDCFALIARQGSDDLVAYNGSGRAPAAATLDWYRDRGIAAIERADAHAVTVPGAVDAWERLLADHGTIPLAQALAPAIALARDGYVVAPRMRRDWSREVAALSNDEAARRIFLPGGSVPEVGEMHCQPELAATLERIARQGRDGFYGGPVAADIVEHLQSLGGLHTLADFASARGEYVTPIRLAYRDHEVCECPPSGQGIIALLILNILKRFPAPGGGPLSVERLHVEIEAARLAYAARDEVLADPAQAPVPVAELLSDALADRLAARIDPPRVLDDIAPHFGAAHSDTVFISVVDRQRNAVSLINSLFANYGSGRVAPRSGVLLHSRGTGFVLTSGHPNAIAPGKRPLHTLIPGMLVRDGRAVMSFGVMGAHYQAMGHVWLLRNRLEYGLDPQTALDLPRYFPLPGTNQVEFEGTMPPAIVAELKRRGFVPVAPAAPIGGGQAIVIDWQRGTLIGASDHRKDGMALGF